MKITNLGSWWSYHGGDLESRAGCRFASLDAARNAAPLGDSDPKYLNDEGS